MNCPYCAERVSDAAIVCKHCHRDLFLIRPLMDKLAEAGKRIEVLEGAGAAEPSAAATGPAMRRHDDALPTLTPLSSLSLMFISLMLAHFVIIVEYSLPLIVLRAVSIILPLGFGFLCQDTPNRTLLVEFIWGLVIAMAAILAMSAVVGRLDHVPVLPRSAYEWREFIEYGASVTFSFFTGVIIRHTVIAMRDPDESHSRLIASATRAFARRVGGKLGRTLDRKVAGVDLRKVGPIVRTAAAIASATVSVTTGFKHFF
jgi:hypothetical protein